MRLQGFPDDKHSQAKACAGRLRFALGPLDEAHAYLKERGLTAETIASFGVGCCAHGMLRGWIAIPIHDIKGRMIAYAGRWPGLDKDAPQVLRAAVPS